MTADAVVRCCLGRHRSSRPASGSSLGEALRRWRTACPMRCSFSISAKRTWPSPPGPKPTSGDTATLASRDQERRELDRPHLGIRLGDGRPDEHRPLRRGDVPSDPIEPVAQRVAARLVDRVDLLREVAGLVQGDRGGDLDRLERAVVEVALELGQRPTTSGLPTMNATRQPAIENDLVIEYSSTATLLGALGLEDRRAAGSRRSRARRRRSRARPSTSRSRAKSTTRCKKSRSTHVVVGLCGNDRTMHPGLGPASTRRPRAMASKKSLVGRRAGSRGRRHRRRAGPRCGSGRTATGTRAASPGWSSTHIRWEKPSLAPMVVMHLGLGVERHAEAALVEVGDGLAELRDAPTGRVAVVPGVAGRLGQLVDRDLGRRQVGVAEAEVDDVVAGAPSLDLQRVDDREDVRRQPVDAAELHAGSVPRRAGPVQDVSPQAARRRRTAQ